MTLISIIIVLLIEQVRALPVQRAVLDPVARLAGFFEEKFNDGGRSHGAIAWGSAWLCRRSWCRCCTAC